MKQMKIYLGAILATFLIACGNNETNTSSNTITNDTNVVVDSQAISSDEIYLTDDDLLNLTIPELRIERNLIFAKHGYQFKSSDLKQYFSQFDWYNPQYENVDDMLTDVDKQNIDLIKQYENEKRSKKSDFDTFLNPIVDINLQSLEITWDYYEDFDFQLINNKYAEMFFNIDTTLSENYGFGNVYAFAKFNIPNSSNIAVLTPYDFPFNEQINLWIFDNFGNKIDVIDIAYRRGEGSAYNTATSVFKNGEFILTEIERVEDHSDGSVNEKITKKQKISFKPITSHIIIEQL